MNDNITKTIPDLISHKDVINPQIVDPTINEPKTETTAAKPEIKTDKPESVVKPPVVNNDFREKMAKVLRGIPYFGTPDIPLTSSTQDHLPIADIIDDVVLFKDGGAAIVLETSSLNFGLLSEKEQGAVVAAYAALINSLSFSMQIMIRTQRKDISGYIKFFDEASKKITNPRLAAITQSYRTFITDSIKKKTVLGKRFFIAIPFMTLELGIKKSAQTLVKKGPLPYPKDYVLRKAKITLFPKRDHLMRQAGRLGLKLKQLTTSELIELYWQINNPEPPAVKKDII